MGTVCLTCGDRGFGQIMENCPKCQDSAQHVYCLDVKPVKYYEKAFIWVCDDCKPVTAPLESHHNHNSKNNKKKSNKKKLARSVAKAKVQICEGNPPEQEAKASEDQLASSDPPEIIEDCYLLHSLSLIQLGGAENYIIFSYFELNVNFYKYIFCCLNSSVGFVCRYRGTLSIMNKDFSIVNGLVAHISNLACAEVFEETKLLPGILFPDLVSRVSVWPKAFQSCGPSDPSIALYFFPDSESNEKDFDNLVESMIQDDLAMRAVLDNAELLIFPSSVLPENLQRFQSKLYLWGVFKKRQQPSHQKLIKCAQEKCDQPTSLA